MTTSVLVFLLQISVIGFIVSALLARHYRRRAQVKGRGGHVGKPIPASDAPSTSSPPGRSLTRWFVEVLREPRLEPVVLHGRFEDHDVEVLLDEPYQFRVRVLHATPTDWTAWLEASGDHPLIPVPGPFGRPSKDDDHLPMPPEDFEWKVDPVGPTPPNGPALTPVLLKALARPWRTTWRAAVTPDAVEIDVLLRDIALGADPAEAFGMEAEELLGELVAISRAFAEEN